jgi:hypothetical protein
MHSLAGARVINLIEVAERWLSLVGVWLRIPTAGYSSLRGIYACQPINIHLMPPILLYSIIIIVFKKINPSIGKLHEPM